jgi:hypothetical protein
MPIKDMTPEEIVLANAEQVAAGVTSTSREARLPGESSSEANARLTQAYKDLLAKPILTEELADLGAEVRYVRSGGAGRGEYRIITPFGTVIPADQATQWSMGIIPSYSKYVTGTTLGMFSNGDGTATNVGEVPVTTITKAGETSTRAFEGQDAYYTAKVGTTGKTQAQLDAAKGQETALQFNKDIATLLGGTVDPATGKVTNVGGKTVASVVPNADGTTTITATDGTKTTVRSPASAPTPVAVSSGGNTPGSSSSNSGKLSASVSGVSENSQNPLNTAVNDAARSERVSAYNLLYDEFDKYGLGSLVSDIRNILVEGSLDPAEFSIKVRGTDAYRARFIANEARLAKGLKALSPAQYIALEDQYQEVMRQYGLPETYYAKTGTGVQEGFRKLIENDVSNIELEDRISTAQKRVLNANPEVTQALKQFYPDITNADILAYTLDPKNAIENIKRKVTAAEIGGAAIQSGLQTGVTRAEELGAAGIDKRQAQEGFGTIAGGLQRGSQLASIYGENPYTQTTAEQEVFGLAGKTEAEKQRKKLTGLEKATFGGQTGLTSGALARDRAGTY